MAESQLPTYGIVFNRQSSQVLPVVDTDMSTIYLVGVSDDAVAATFPLYTNVVINSSDPAALAALGTGDLCTDVVLINAQLAPREVAARIVIHRVPKGASDSETIANILGTEASGTGIFGALSVYALGYVARLIVIAGGYTGKNITRSAPVTTVTEAAKFGGNTGTGLLTLAAPAYGAGVKPGLYRVHCTGGILAVSAAPEAGNTGTGTITGLTVDGDAPVGTWRLVCGLAAVNGGYFTVLRPDGTQDGIAVVGSAYNSPHGPNFTISDGATDFVKGDAFDLTVVNAVPSAGGVFGVADPDGTPLAPAIVGTAYAGPIAFTLSHGGTDFVVGDGFDVLVTQTGGLMNANPIAAALPQIEAALAAHSVIDGPNTTPQDARDYRATLASDHTILVDFAVTPSAAAAGTFVPGSAVAAGIGVRVDYDNDGIPSQSWANQAVYGITALKRYDSFSLNSGTNTGQELLAQQVGICQRGNPADPGAVSSSGFMLVAFDGCGPDDEWRHFNVTRMRDYIHLNLQGFWRLRIGVNNITLHAVQAVENDAIRWLGLLKGDAKQHIIDFRVGINANDNTPSTIEAGKLRVYFKCEEAGPLLLIVADSYRYPDALTALAAQIAGETNQVLTAS